MSFASMIGGRIVGSKIVGQIEKDMQGLNFSRLWLYSSASGIGGVCGSLVFSVSSWIINKRQMAEEFSGVNNKINTLIMDTCTIHDKMGIPPITPVVTRPTSGSLADAFMAIFPLPWQRELARPAEARKM